ncbi:MAG: hypothetical protein AAF927_18210 [Bacteroidota bacterium]
MKNLLFLTLLLASQSLFAQNGTTRGGFQIDRIVLIALQEDYPGARNIAWVKNKQNFEARFQHLQYDMKVIYSPDGLLLFEEFVVPNDRYESLKAIWTHLAETYPGYSLQGIYLCNAISKEYYRAEIRYRGQTLKLKFDTESMKLQE